MKLLDRRVYAVPKKKKTNRGPTLYKRTCSRCSKEFKSPGVRKALCPTCLGQVHNLLREHYPGQGPKACAVLLRGLCDIHWSPDRTGLEARTLGLRVVDKYATLRSGGK